MRTQVEKTFLYTFKLYSDGKLIGQWNVGTAQSFGHPAPEVKKAAPPAKPAK